MFDLEGIGDPSIFRLIRKDEDLTGMWTLSFLSNRILIYECQCDERLRPTVERSTRFTYTTGELSNVERTEHLKNVFCFHIFENLHLGILLDFIYSNSFKDTDTHDLKLQ